MLIPSEGDKLLRPDSSLSRRVNANSQPSCGVVWLIGKLIKKGEC